MRAIFSIAIACLFVLQIQAEEKKSDEEKNLKWKATLL